MPHGEPMGLPWAYSPNGRASVFCDDGLLEDHRVEDASPFKTVFLVVVVVEPPRLTTAI